MASVTVLQTGSTLVSPAVPNRGARSNPLAYTGLMQRRSQRIEVPVKCFLVDVAGRKTLIDTGWSAQDADHGLRHLGFGLWFASEPVMERSEAVPAQLERLGLAVDDLDAVAFTHLDCDHVGGADGIAQARRVLVSREELEGAHGPRYNKRLWKGVDFEHLAMATDPDAPFGCSCDVYGDGSLTAYLVPGHSAGSVVYVARNAQTGRTAAIVGDTGYNEASWHDLNLPGPVYNKENMYRALAWVRDLRLNPTCIGAFVAHDPAVPPGAYEF